MSRPWAKAGLHAASITLLLGVFYLLAKDSLPVAPYIYDEADYMYAVSRGFGANYTDSPTLPLIDFVKIGLSRGKDAGQQTGLSELIRRDDDMVFYRHWHGPVYLDWLHALNLFTTDERATRAWSYLFPILTALVMYWGALWLLPRGAGQIAAILGAALFLWSFPVINSPELAPHELFVLCVTGALLALGKLMQSGERKHWYIAVVLTAVAFCVLEVAFALIATAAICGHSVRDRLKPDFRLALNTIGAFVGTVLVLWPGAIFKLSFVKAYLFMAYLAVFRKGAWGSDISVGGTWWLRFINGPVVWILLAVAIFLLIRYRRNAERTIWSPVMLPLLIYAASMFLAIFRVNSEIPRYILPLFPALVLIAAFTMGRWLANFKAAVRWGAVAVVCAAVIVTTAIPVVVHRPERDPKIYSLLDLVKSENLSHKKLLVPQGALPTVHYYYPSTQLRGYVSESEIPGALRDGSFDGVIREGNPAQYVKVRE